MGTSESLPVLTYTIHVPRMTVWEPKGSHQFMEQILFAFDGMFFTIVATKDRIVWRLIDQRCRDRESIESAIRASYPEAQIVVEPLDARELADRPIYRYVIKYQHALRVFLAPMKSVLDITGPDPLAAMTQAMSELQEGERICYTLIVVGHADYAYAEGEKLITANERNGSLFSLAFPTKVPRYEPATQHILEAKLNESRLYQAALFVQLDVVDPARFASLLVVDNHMVNFDRAKFNGLRYIDDKPHLTSVMDDTTDIRTSALGLYDSFLEPNKSQETAQLQEQSRLILTAGELASLYHLPHQGFSAPTIAWARVQVRAPIAITRNRDGIGLGLNTYAGRSEPIILPLRDRSGHISVIGKAGVGKSTLVHQLVHQDIMQNRVVIVIDPHGPLVSDILRTSIPPSREHDVIVLDVANEDYPPPMNLLSVPNGTDPSNAAGQVMAVVKTFYEGFEGRMADTLWGALVTLMQDENPTIRDIARLFRDKAYRARLVAKLDNVIAEEFWADFEALSNAQQEQLSYPVNQRMRAFYGSKALYPILCHPDTLDFASLIAQNKIILVSLKADDARIPEREQQLLGAALLSQLRLAVMRRPVGSQPCYLYVDEVQRFVTTSLKDMFSESRKFGLSLTVANQYLKQLAGDTLDALIGNIGAMIVFQCGHEDARLLTPYMSPGFDTESLINLDKYEAAVKLRYCDETQPAFSLRTFTPFEPEDGIEQAKQREERIRRLSIEQYTPKHRTEVMAWLGSRYGKQPPSIATDFDTQ